jgi:hypothetical protein
MDPPETICSLLLNRKRNTPAANPLRAVVFDCGKFSQIEIAAPARVHRDTQNLGFW